jgi:hypothetical protein
MTRFIDHFAIPKKGKRGKYRHIIALKEVIMAPVVPSS